MLVEHFRVDADMGRHGPSLEGRANIAAAEEAVEVDHAAGTGRRRLCSLGNRLELGHAALPKPHRGRERRAFPEMRADLGTARRLCRALACIELQGLWRRLV